jgi:hypothetical protein
VGAQGIEAESPQKAHRRFRGLGADSPALEFLPRSGENFGDAPKFLIFPLKFTLSLSPKKVYD